MTGHTIDAWVEAAKAAYLSGATWAAENPIHADMPAQRRMSADAYVAALAAQTEPAKAPRDDVRMPPDKGLGPQLREPSECLRAFTVLKEAFSPTAQAEPATPAVEQIAQLIRNHVSYSHRGHIYKNGEVLGAGGAAQAISGLFEARAENPEPATPPPDGNREEVMPHYGRTETDDLRAHVTRPREEVRASGGDTLNGEPIGYVNVYLDEGTQELGGVDLYETVEEATETAADEFAEHVGVFAVVPIAAPPSDGLAGRLQGLSEAATQGTMDDEPYDPLKCAIWAALMPFRDELIATGGVTFMGLRNSIVEAVRSFAIASQADALARSQPEAPTAVDPALTEEVWGIEDVGHALWVGPMRPDGIKVDHIVYGADFTGYRQEYADRVRRDARLIVGSVNAALRIPSPDPWWNGDNADAALAAASGGETETETACIACGLSVKDGDPFYEDVNEGPMHAECCGPERESYVGADGEPLKPGDPIPEPNIYRSLPAASDAERDTVSRVEYESVVTSRDVFRKLFEEMNDQLTEVLRVVKLYGPPALSGDGSATTFATPDAERETDTLVDRFAVALKAKLRAAEKKYDRNNAWAKPDWEADCQRDIARHLAKGDPLDVAAYAAFCWHHGWPTASAVEASDAGNKAFDRHNAGLSSYPEPWKHCPSGYCERSAACNWPNDCTVRSATGSKTEETAGPPPLNFEQGKVYRGLVGYLYHFTAWRYDEKRSVYWLAVVRRSNETDGGDWLVMRETDFAELIVTDGDEPFPKPGRRDGKEPCGECHLHPGETCDICGAKQVGPRS